MLYMPLSHGSPRAGGILPSLSYLHYVVRTATPPGDW